MNETNTTLESINRETAKIRWSELEKHFASGNLIAVDTTLDLVKVAYDIAVDNKTQVSDWLDQSLLQQVTDSQAIEWQTCDQQLWAVVIKPWILVQPVAEQ